MSPVAAVLVNPAAGRGRAGGLVAPVREALAAAGFDVLVLAGRSADESTALSRLAVADGADALVAIGGDGLVHCSVQALAGSATPLAILGAGTGNDLAEVLGHPRDPVALAAMIAAGRIADLDAGLVLPAAAGAGGEPVGRFGDAVGERWFAGVLCAGFDSAVNERANRMRWPRGPRRYDLAVFGELSRLRPLPMSISVDGEQLETDVTLVAVANCARYGGGMRICPDARMDDGVFDVTVVGPLSRATLVRLKPLLRTGRHVEHPSVRVLRGKEVRLSSPGVVAYADGERVGPLPLTVACVPYALRAYLT